jgi:hypothetical protein
LNIARWIAQGLCAELFLFAGGSKLNGVPAMVQTFDGIGFANGFDTSPAGWKS